MSLSKPKSAPVQVSSRLLLLLFCFISCFEPLCCLLLLRFLAEPLKNLSKLSVRRNNNNNNNYSATKWKETTKCGTSGWAG